MTGVIGLVSSHFCDFLLFHSEILNFRQSALPIAAGSTHVLLSSYQLGLPNMVGTSQVPLHCLHSLMHVLVCSLSAMTTMHSALPSLILAAAFWVIHLLYIRTYCVVSNCTLNTWEAQYLVTTP